MNMRQVRGGEDGGGVGEGVGWRSGGKGGSGGRWERGLVLLVFLWATRNLPSHNTLYGVYFATYARQTPRLQKTVHN